MKTMLKLAEMIDYGPSWLKDAAHNVAKDAGVKTDDLELHRLGHSEKSAVNGLDPKSRQSLKYVSTRTQDRDDEIVIPRAFSSGALSMSSTPLTVAVYPFPAFESTCRIAAVRVVLP